MGEIDIQSLLVEISAESPCGENLSYDQAYLALEDLIRTKSTGGVVSGAEETFEEPNWREVREKSIELLHRSKDIRIVIYLTLALLRIEGIPGLRDGLFLLQGLLERFWDNVYPQLDPEDNNDPLERINILQSLSPASISEQDPMKFRQRLMEVPLCNSAQMGRFSLRDIQTAKREIAIPEDQERRAPGIAVIDAAFQDTQTEELLAISQATEEAIECIAAITSVFSQNASQGETPNLSGFKSALENIRKCLQGYLAKRGYGEAPVESAESTGGESEGGAMSITGEIRSNKEALLAIEKACQYFERHEPSSPVPLLLRRAQRLVSKSFLEVIRDVCPDALSQIQAVGGISEGDSKNETE